MNISVMMDVVIAAVLIIFAAAGWKNGLIRSLVGLAAMILAVKQTSLIVWARATARSWLSNGFSRRRPV